MDISGIYKIESKIKPQRIYIGSATNIRKRWRLHLLALKNNKHYNKKLQRHFNKYGKTDLQFSILLGCEKEDLIKIEQYFIDSYNPYFNTCKIAYSVLGLNHSKETKSKISKAHKGKPRSEETKRKISESHKGLPGTRLGAKHSLESRKKMSEVMKGKIPWIKGRHLSDEHKRKIGEANKGKSYIKGRQLSEETKIKISKAKKGKPGRKQSEESKKKISIGIKKYWNTKNQLLQLNF